MTYMVRITGKRAVEYAEAHGVSLEQGGDHIERDDGSFRSTLEGDQDWDSVADDGDDRVYVEFPAPYAVARYCDGPVPELDDIEYFESMEDARRSFAQAAVPSGSTASVHLVEVDEDGEPLRVLIEKVRA